MDAAGGHSHVGRPCPTRGDGTIHGAGFGVTYGALPALIMAAVDPSQTGAANSLNTLMRSLGTSFASAIAGVILAQTTTDFGGHALPSENGFKVVMAIGAGAALLAFLVTTVIPRRKQATAEAVDGAGEAETVSQPA